MFKQTQRIILASNSYGRKYVLDFANIDYCIAENIVNDSQEDSFKQTVEHLAITEQIKRISAYKGLEISKNNPDSYILSGDQASVVDGEIISKPKTRSEAIGQLTSHAGKTYELVTSVSLCKNGKIIWQHQETPTVTLRKFSMREAEKYVDLEEQSATGSVVGIAGACKIESALGAHMIKSVDGSHHTIIGLPLHALMDKLYELNILT